MEHIPSVHRLPQEQGQMQQDSAGNPQASQDPIPLTVGISTAPQDSGGWGFKTQVIKGTADDRDAADWQ